MQLIEVNAKGQCVGTFKANRESVGVAFIYENGVLKKIGEQFLPRQNDALAINDTGAVLIATFAEGDTGPQTHHLWSDGKWRDVSGFDECADLNNQGAIVGARVRGNQGFEVCLRTPAGNLLSIPKFGQYQNCRATRFSHRDRDEILGTATDWPLQALPNTGFAYDAGNFSKIPLQQVRRSCAADFFLGTIQTAGRGVQAALVEKGDLIKIEPIGWRYSWADCSNRHGAIVGHGTSADGHSRVFVLTPKKVP
jgi:hypothetical protein